MLYNKVSSKERSESMVGSMISRPRLVLITARVDSALTDEEVQTYIEEGLEHLELETLIEVEDACTTKED
jgi:hypothetical protein